ncbi:alpha/beta hydrolase [Microbacterium sp. NPDC096154]|uniref:alpha/beta hydrolase n=1 Tax=Microbacterium sp. NPDC096154 TaxID=3155549 RepID=UPI003321A5AF
MALHPKVAEFLAGLPPHEPGPVDPAVLRAEEESHVPPLQDRLPLHSVEDLDADGVPVRVYRATDDSPTGVIAYFHGGAFFLGSLETHDHVARELAKASGLTVVAVGYRRAPEAAFPAGLDDCLAVVRWIASRPGELGWDGETLAVAGDSSGGTFAAAVAALAKDAGLDAITHQVLMYPSLDLDFDEDRWPSLRENAVGYGLETAGLKPFNAFYIDSGADPADPRVSPIKREDLTGLPQALILTAEHDPLRDEGEAYGDRLRTAGVEARVSRYEGAGHGFIQHFGWLPEFHRAYDEIASFLQNGVAR